MREDSVWRDEKRLPLADLRRAMATNSGEGQADDPTGGDAGSEQEFGDGLRNIPELERDPDPDSEEGRRLRPSPDTDLTGPA